MIYAAHNQLSLMPMFGVVDHPDAQQFNATKDLWNNQFGQFATLERYAPGMTSTSQSIEQLERLVVALSHSDLSKTMYAINVGSPMLNAKIKRFLSAAEMIRQERAFRPRKQAGPTAEDLAKGQADEAQKRHEQLLAALSLKEKLLAHESEFEKEDNAWRSSLVRQSAQFSELRAVVTPKKIRFGGHDAPRNLMDVHNAQLAQIMAKERECWKTTYILTFELMASST